MSPRLVVSAAAGLLLFVIAATPLGPQRAWASRSTASTPKMYTTRDDVSHFGKAVKAFDVVTNFEHIRDHEPAQSQLWVHRRQRRSISPSFDHNEAFRTLFIQTHGLELHLVLSTDIENYRHGTPKHRIVTSSGERLIQVDRTRHLHGFVDGFPGSEVAVHLHDNEATGAIRLNETTTFLLEPAAKHLKEFHENPTQRGTVVYSAAAVSPLTSSACGLAHSHENGQGSEGHGTDASLFANLNNRFHDAGFEPEGLRSPERMRKEAPSASTFSTCLLQGVADSQFISNAGSEEDAVHLMISYIRMADLIFRRTDFGNGLTDLGAAIIETTLFPETASDPYFSATSAWTAQTLLTEFAGTNFDSFCLGFLFTNYDLPNGVLGLANVASSSPNAGGVCSHSVNGAARNVALMTEQNFGSQQPLLLLALVVAHELGHAFGSLHDAENDPICNPDAGSGGHFLMYATSVDGSQANNDELSPCSSEAIGTVLQNPHIDCFSRQPMGFCGDSSVNPAGADGILGNADDEECDVGANGGVCCTSECKLQPGASCDDTNSVCCENCQFNAATVCFEAFDSDALCRTASTCGADGNTDPNICPATGFKDPGALCTSLGECTLEPDDVTGSRCKPFCQRFGAVECECPEETDSCRLCCIHPTNSTIDPFCERGFLYLTAFNNDTMLNETTCFPTEVASTGTVNAMTSRSTPLTPFLSAEPTCKRASDVLVGSVYDFVVNGVNGDAETPSESNLIYGEGSFCPGGRCDLLGNCAADDSYKRLVDFFASLSAESVANWSRTNIVAVTLIAMLLFFIPVMCCFNHYDAKYEAERKPAVQAEEDRRIARVTEHYFRK